MGPWSYSAQFRTGANVAVSLAANPGSPLANVGAFDGNGMSSGQFTVAASNKLGADFIDANGETAFAVLAEGVPEPETAWLLIHALAILWRTRRFPAPSNTSNARRPRRARQLSRF